MKVLLRVIVVLFLCATAMSAQNQAGAPNSFALGKDTEISGKKVHAGNYNLAVAGRLADRVIMQLSSSDGKTQTLLLGVPANLTGTSGQPVFWDAKDQGKHALRGFVFADGRSVEFVYPKADAVALAKANHSSVVAVDTASEGRPELGRLSNQDMQMVNLWLLTPTRISSGQDGLEAKHYQPSGSNSSQPQVAQNASGAGQAQGAATQQIASASRTAVQPVSTSSTALVRQVKRPAPPASTLRASATVPKGLKRLPQTASSLPLWFLLTGTSLFGAAALRVRRTAQAGV